MVSPLGPSRQRGAFLSPPRPVSMLPPWDFSARTVMLTSPRVALALGWGPAPQAGVCSRMRLPAAL